MRPPPTQPRSLVSLQDRERAAVARWLKYERVVKLRLRGQDEHGEQRGPAGARTAAVVVAYPIYQSWCKNAAEDDAAARTRFREALAWLVDREYAVVEEPNENSASSPGRGIVVTIRYLP